MVTRSDDYLEYCRETAKHARDPHDLALRGREKKEVTKLVHQQIAEAVDLRPGDDLVDIGCGDGTMLRIADAAGAKSAIGLLATDEEVAVLRRFGLNAKQGLTERLPLPDASASVIVCNSVLLVVPREKISVSLREMHRIAKPEARIFVGEIPYVEPHDPTPQFASRRELLSHLYRKHGFRTWFGMLRRMAYRQLTANPLSSTAEPPFRSGPQRRSSLQWLKTLVWSLYATGSVGTTTHATTTCSESRNRQPLNKKPSRWEREGSRMVRRLCADDVGRLKAFGAL